jgi:hypothetical protein
MEIWREGAREGGMGWDGGHRKEREQKVERCRVREATHWLSTVWPVIVGSVGQLIKIAMLRVKNDLPFLEC